MIVCNNLFKLLVELQIHKLKLYLFSARLMFVNSG
jgi:hypothetical protein